MGPTGRVLRHRARCRSGTDDAALTDVASQASIPVTNIDHKLSRTFAAPVTILGDKPDSVAGAIASTGRGYVRTVGGAGSASAVCEIQPGMGVVEVTVIYPSTQAADGIRLARMIVQGKALSDLVEVEIPNRIVLNAPGSHQGHRG